MAWFRLLLVLTAGCGGTSLRASTKLGTAAELIQAIEQGRRRGADVYFLIELLDKLKVFASKSSASEEQRHDEEETRLQAAMKVAQSSSDKSLLEMDIQRNEETRMQTEYAEHEMLSFYYTIKAQLGGQGTAPKCEYLQCGANAECVSATSGVECKCKSCYAGDGFTCRASVCTPSKVFTAQSLVPHIRPTWTPKVADIHLSILGADLVAVVWRDHGVGDGGYMMIGQTRSEVRWGQLEPIGADGQVWGPAIAAATTRKLVLAYRDADKGGIGYLAGAQVNSKFLNASLSKPIAFSRQQAQTVSLVPMSEGRVICLYSERKLDANGKITEAFGGAALLSLNGNAVSIMGSYHFAEDPVARIAATALSPTSAVVAFRAAPLDGVKKGASKELSAVWMEVKDDELVIEPRALTLEAYRKDMWSRDVSLLAENTFAYTYQSGSEEKTKLAVVHVDPATHEMKVVGRPFVIGQGTTPYVKGIDVPYRHTTPRTFTMFQRPAEVGTARSCNIGMTGAIVGCKDVKWATVKVSTVSAAKLVDGRLFFTFADVEGVPYFQMIDAV